MRARICAYEESPEGRARSRIFELLLKGFRLGYSPAEQEELDRLRAIYPDLPLDQTTRLRIFERSRASSDVALQGRRWATLTTPILPITLQTKSAASQRTCGTESCLQASKQS